MTNNQQTFEPLLRRILRENRNLCFGVGELDQAELDLVLEVRGELPEGVSTFQEGVSKWMLECFTPEIAADKTERNHRFLEEALELVQSIGCTRSEAHQLVDYVYGRDIGDPPQEVGGVMVTLAALCLANDMDMNLCGDVELERISDPETVLKIRAKQAAKPKHSPLPQAEPAQSGQDGAPELLPCPFCGGDYQTWGSIRDGRSLGCSKCGVRFAEYNGPPDNTAENRLVTAWNARTHQAALTERDARIAELEEALNEIAEIGQLNLTLLWYNKIARSALKKGSPDDTA